MSEPMMFADLELEPLGPAHCSVILFVPIDFFHALRSEVNVGRRIFTQRVLILYTSDHEIRVQKEIFRRTSTHCCCCWIKDFFHALWSEVNVGRVRFSPLSARAHRRFFRRYKSIARELQPRFCPGFSGFLPKVS
ncbi:hypothetical protein HF521_015873 [Silurus meridionalis]|uniref:Uncharacterized protein n=1 Tax=Silurus meridionalis TaxID=175797 RepID=A0A8T0A5W5_SILME|nr:hypothetical protein HF521_015873 [Silurus meridionalis]